MLCTKQEKDLEEAESPREKDVASLILNLFDVQCGQTFVLK